MPTRAPMSSLNSANLCRSRGVVVAQKSFRVENHDSDPDDPKSVKGVLHNPHSFFVKGASSATDFNIGLAEKGSKLDKPVKFKGGQEKTGSTYRLQCDQHEFMQGFYSRSGILTMPSLRKMAPLKLRMFRPVSIKSLRGILSPERWKPKWMCPRAERLRPSLK